ncbi:MAG TPA: SGNH/GDSL hydrolase family protein [Phycisphaerae bacterium]|nr:SGNH/GDSL hydrolase family protein [Phycisphaerae bacterium]
MKEVVLIGDSIRMGYQAFVERELGDELALWWPEENGGTSRNILDHLDDWVISRRPALVHINCGLHDLKKERGSSEALVPLDEYGRNVAKILKSVADGTDAKVIWATTTPVNQQWHRQRKPFDRFEDDVVAYNRESVATAERLGVAVNDLYAVMVQAGADSYLSPDGVHFNDVGYALLGKAVADAIRRHV